MTNTAELLASFIGREYPAPHGCVNLAADVLRTVYGLPIPPQPALDAFNIIRNYMRPVEAPAAGDVVLLRGEQWHVAVATGPDTMIHAAPPAGQVVIDDITGLQWRARTRGYYRWIQ